jgi:HEAT repeat protein
VLQRLMSESNMEIANQLAAVLARVRSMAALEACREVVAKAQNPAARYAMVLNLTASVHGEAGLSLVHEYVLDGKQDPRARAAILTAIGQAIKGNAMDANQGVSFLMEMQIEPSLPVSLRQAALIALGISSQPSAARYLSMVVSDSDPQMRVAAVDALGRSMPPQVALLEKLARGGDQAVRGRANQILNQLQAVLKQKSPRA